MFCFFSFIKIIKFSLNNCICQHQFLGINIVCHLHICLQITELLDDERCEAECEELPQDGEEAPTSPNSPQRTETDDSPAAR